MGRRRRVNETELQERLAKPPKLTAASRKRIEAIEQDPAKRASMKAEVAQLDEGIAQMREEMLRGKAFAVANLARLQKLRAELLRLKTADAGQMKRPGPSAPPWVKQVIEERMKKKPPDATPASADDADLDDLDAALTAELARTSPAPATPAPPAPPAPAAASATKGFVRPQRPPASK